MKKPKTLLKQNADTRKKPGYDRDKVMDCMLIMAFVVENEILWSKLEKDNDRRRKELLKKIAVVNLKKIPGGHTSDGKTIFDAAFENDEIIKKQLALYDADFIICCGTEPAFVNACYKGIERNWKMTDRGVWFFRDGKTVVISFAHPEVRVRDSYLYYALLDAVREIMTGASI